ncbi:MAG: TlyA family RNA methyltransferase [Cyanobacteria bacterium REEB65]|nr:TlyA family RNA methyltransferase [Cyanobacteria bacterium REEB65]
MPKERLDQRLVREGLFASREAAQRAIMAGLVMVGAEAATKPGTMVGPEVVLKVRGPEQPYVSRGGVKLAHALDRWPIDVSGRICLDIGASTGGFTDVLLQRGAARVYAIDVGYGQLAWKLREDPRVTVVERTNVRHLDPASLYHGEPAASFAVVDVSFIGLAKIIPALGRLLASAGEIVALIKPQFEAGPQWVGKHGVVRDAAVHREVVQTVTRAFESAGLAVQDVSESPIKGSKGNVEFLLWAKA